MIYLILFTLFIIFPYEYLFFGEDILFSISFSIFVYYMIKTVSDFFYLTLESRKIYVLNLFKFYFTFLISTLNDLIYDLSYFVESNLNENFASSFSFFLAIIDYNIFLSSTVFDVSNADRNLIFSDFVSSLNIQHDSELTVLEYFKR